jgi:hypothetical protein
MSNATGRPALPPWSQLLRAHSTRERRQPNRTVKVSLRGSVTPAPGCSPEQFVATFWKLKQPSTSLTACCREVPEFRRITWERLR